MPWTNQLKDERYVARYRLPSGEKRTVNDLATGKPTRFTHKQKAFGAAVVAEEAAKSVAWRDPKDGEKKWDEWCDAWWPTRAVEDGVLKRDASSVKVVRAKWGDTALINITRFAVKQWVGELRATGMSAATIEKRLYLLSASLNAAIDAGVLTLNVAYRIPVVKGETDVRRYLTEKEVSALVSRLSGIDLSLALTLFGTGMRWGEAVGLQKKRVDLKRGIITVAEVWDRDMARLKPYTKSGHIRDIPIPEWLVPHLKERMKLPADRLFPFNHHSNWVRRRWAPAVAGAGLSGVRIHDARHTYASRLLTGGMSLAAVGVLLGHVSPQTTAIYAKVASVPHQSVLDILKSPVHVSSTDSKMEDKKDRG